jgi:RimJ/RimL family protein N-acetyltransferase
LIHNKRNHVNRNAEIALIANPDMKGHGFGRKILEMLLNKGFNYLGFKNIFGETYICNDSYEFWEKYIKEKNLYSTKLPNRKFYNGIYHDGIYFNIKKEDFSE